MKKKLFSALGTKAKEKSGFNSSIWPRKNIQPELSWGLLLNFSSLFHLFYELLRRRGLVDLLRLSHLRWGQDLWLRSGLVVYCLRSFRQQARISSFQQPVQENWPVQDSELLGGSEVGLSQKAGTPNRSARSPVTVTAGCALWYHKKLEKTTTEL